ncbi:MAG: cell division protein ZapA [Crocinitomicaceae bacterium]|jgi:cell division protein ZapA|nr:cell division protein ZapA [Crocinitomicaceae bacterium]MDG1036936.1 cell division protein ZapA [Crocinitomicaceae bacterium]MDG1741273.1 cell division protein ZapA [Crocinitomicaceae bacterium]
MAKLSLKVIVAGRTYPLSVSEDEQDRVLKAAEDINKAIKLLKDNYAVKDMQDLLAMTALQLASKPESKEVGSESSAAELKDIEQKLQDLSDGFES